MKEIEQILSELAKAENDVDFEYLSIVAEERLHNERLSTSEYTHYNHIYQGILAARVMEKND